MTSTNTSATSTRASIQLVGQILDEITEEQSMLSEITAEASISTRDHYQKIISVIQRYYRDFHQALVLDFKDNVVNSVKSFITKKNMQLLGLSLLNRKSFQKPVKQSAIIPSISQLYWQKIGLYIFQTPQMQSVLNHLGKYYDQEIEKKIEAELQQVPMQVDKIIRSKYKQVYLNNPLSFQEFLNLDKSQSSDQSFNSNNDTNSDVLRQQFEQALEKKKLEEKKVEQLESFDDYDKYFSMSERELERAKRQGNRRHKYKKKTRRGKN
ncbi:MAG: hypothetical protein ACTSRK_01355 [Promethearchaeota archaeon]